MTDKEIIDALYKENHASVHPLYNDELFERHPFFSGSFTYGMFIGAKWMERRIKQDNWASDFLAYFVFFLGLFLGILVML